MKDLLKNKYLLKILTIFLIIIVNFSILNKVFAFEIEEEIDYAWVENEILKASSNSLEELNLSSRYIVAFDIESKAVLYGKNENEKTPMASTTKIMTAIVLLENLGNKNLSLDTEVEVCKEAASIGGSRLGLKTGDIITINDLIYGLMLCSRK